MIRCLPVPGVFAEFGDTGCTAQLNGYLSRVFVACVCVCCVRVLTVYSTR
jgi:hypothetical protein